MGLQEGWYIYVDETLDSPVEQDEEELAHKPHGHVEKEAVSTEDFKIGINLI